MNVADIAQDDSPSHRSLSWDFLSIAARNPGTPGLISDRDLFSYGDIAGLAASWAMDIRSKFSPRSQFQITAIIASSSSPVAYIGSLAAQIAGTVFIPIDPALPAGVIIRRLRDVRPACIALDARCKGVLPALNGQAAPVMLWDEHRAAPGGPPGKLEWQPGRPASLVYILSTSGSTGPAKLTPIRAVGAWQAVAQVRRMLGLGAADRLIQTFPIGFDLSILSTYLAWTSGSALVLSPRPDQPESILLTSAAESCTVWFSVPSLARLIPEKASLPAVRHSLFCGEALYASDVMKWRGIAGNSTVHNLYGPTECAMVATHYECPDALGPGVVPIGWPLPGVETEVAERPGGPGELGAGAAGELLLGGRQVMPGYWRRPEETRRSMVVAADGRRRMYRTGDLVTRDASGLLHFIGRVDDQVKVMGHRIELQEISLALARIDGVSEAVAFTVTDEATLCERLVAAYTSDNGVNPAQVHQLLLSRLPRWMVPWPIIQAAALPRNSSGKTSAAMLRQQFVSGGIS